MNSCFVPENGGLIMGRLIVEGKATELDGTAVRGVDVWREAEMEALDKRRSRL